ncbi:hypothetical protein ACFP3U_24755 [Kitasatospora misakiensis]|uniref:Uncharacterized protein n=1 Tax=Kitasatospora misakiensis TaxID=67330 RepID=A0ABW0X6K8_9ACTN
MALYRWFARFTPYDVERSAITVDIENTTDAAFQIRSIEIEKISEGRPLDAVSIGYPGGGASRITAVLVNLDESDPIAREITYGDGVETIAIRPYFEDHVIDLKPGEIHSLKIVGKTLLGRYRWSASLRISSPSWKNDKVLPLGEILRTSAIPEVPYGRDLAWSWFDGPEGARFRDISDLS